MTQESLNAFTGERSKSEGEVFESLREGDKIQFDAAKFDTENPHTVKAGYDGSKFVAIEGPGGGTRMLMQNENDRNWISVMSMNTTGGATTVSDLRVVEEAPEMHEELDHHDEVERTYPSGNYVRAKVNNTPETLTHEAYELRVLEGDDADRGDVITSHADVAPVEWSKVDQD